MPYASPNFSPALRRLFRFRPSGWLVAAGALLLAFVSTATAQPSGGPYGPQKQRYEVPANATNVYYVSPDGRLDATGASLDQPTTLPAAIAKAVTGDAIILRGGVYRVGSLKVNQGITLQPYLDEHAVLKGTEVATKWEAQRNRLWRTTWTKLFPSKPADWWRRHRHGAETPPYRFHNDMVFVNGKMLTAVGWEGEVDENSYTIDYETGTIYIGVDPTNKLVEITAHDSAITRVTGEVHGKQSDKKGLNVRGLTFTQYAYRAFEIEGREPESLADPATFGKDVVGSTFEHVTITHCSRVAGYFRGDKMVFRNCLISDTSTEGIYIISSADVLLERNIIRRNNVEKITGYFPAAVKIFNQTYRVICRDNVVQENPNSSGIWYDVGNVDGVFVNNWIEGTNDGFFFEISKGAICAGNVFVNCNKGIRILNSSNVVAYNNTFVNSVAAFERTERSAVGDHFGWHPSTGPDVHERHGHRFVNNLMVANAEFAGPLIQFEQPTALCARLTEPQVSELNNSLYVRRDGAASQPLIVWSPAKTKECTTALPDLAALRALHPQFESNGVHLANFHGALFRSEELKNFEPVFPHAAKAAPVPANVAAALRASPAEVGAYGRSR
jgi:hypothetical protein